MVKLRPVVAMRLGFRIPTAALLFALAFAACENKPPTAPSPSPSPSPTPTSCAFTVGDGPAAAVAGAGTEFTVAITTTDACVWTAASNATFITVKGAGSGTGSGAVTFVVAANTGSSRQGSVTVAGKSISVTQDAPPPEGACAFNVSPTQVTAPAGGTVAMLTVSVTSGSSCAWTAQSEAAFVTIAAGASGVGNGQVAVNVEPNAGAPRSGSATVAGRAVTVLQSGAPLGSGRVAYLAIQSDEGDYVGAGQSTSYVLDGSQFTVTNSPGNEVRFAMVPAGQWVLWLGAPTFQPLQLGLTDNAGRFSTRPTSQAGIEFFGMGRGCNQVTGRFLITEYRLGGGGSIDRFHAWFEQHCEGWSVALRGELWIDANGASPPPIVPPPTPGTPTTFFSYQSDPGDFVGGGQSGTLTLPANKAMAWTNPARPASVNITLQAPTGAPLPWQLSFQGPSGSGSLLQPGTYTGATRYGFQTAGEPGLNVQGNSHTCGALTGSFVVLEASYGPQGEVLRFRATFEQHCGTAVPALRGEVYIVANPWR